MLKINKIKEFYIASGITDLRKSVDGLTIILQEEYKLDAFSNHLFLFCNRERNKLKILHWEHNGFWLYYRRLEKGKFKWPDKEGQVSKVNREELEWLLGGLSLIQHQKKHEEVQARIAY